MSWAGLLPWILHLSVLKIQADSDHCCDFKVVGGVDYVKISRGAVPPQCKSDCIYEREDTPGSSYCFAQGRLEKLCMDGRQDSKERSKVDDISWLTKQSLEVRFSDNSTQRILVHPANLTGGACFFTGALENDPSSAVDISGCRGDMDVNITITSNKFKEGVVFINIYGGEITEKDNPPYPWDEDMIMGRNTTDDSNKRKSMAISLWPNKVLWYDLTDIGSSAQRQQIKNVLNELETDVNNRETCIQFRERNYGNRVKVTNTENGCTSFVGYHHREDQKLNLNLNRCRRKSTVQHEFFHALGMVHTQQRADRDRYIRLLYDENSYPAGASSFRANHAKCENCNTYGIPYDFLSILHYKGSSGIRTLDPAKQSLIGNSETASPDDLEMVRKMYCGTEPPAFVSCGGQFVASCANCLSCDGDCGMHDGQCKALVTCGSHKAVTCALCTGDHGASWCNGDCAWLDGQCKAALKSCGGHSAPTCGECGQNPSYCNGDCVWTNGQCRDVLVSGISEPCTCKDNPGYQRSCPRYVLHKIAV